MCVHICAGSLDALTREGLPHRDRQLLLREEQVFDLCLRCTDALVQGGHFTRADVRGGHKTLHRACKLFMRLCWHLLRDNNTNRQYAVQVHNNLTSPHLSLPT